MFRLAASARPVFAHSVHTRPAARGFALVAVAAATAAVGNAGCRDVTAPEQDPTTVQYAPALGIRLSDYTKDTSGVYYRDVVVGTGLKAVPKSTIAYYYTGYLADGRTFGTNTSATTPLTFVVGNGEVVRGFDRGLLGINQGGRRRLIIPPALGYGNTSRGTAIPAGSVLIFEVDAAGVTAPATTTTTSKAR